MKNLLIFIFVTFAFYGFGQTLLDSQTTGSSGQNQLQSGGYKYYGNTFSPSTTAVLGSIKLYLSKTGTPTGNATVRIYAATLGTYGVDSRPAAGATILATSDNLDVATLGTKAIKTLIFSGANKITLTAGAYYSFLLYYAGGDGSNTVNIHKSSTSVHPGNINYSMNGSSWSTTSTNDEYFEIWSEARKNVNSLFHTDL